jgi:hypothetical protein
MKATGFVRCASGTAGSVYRKPHPQLQQRRRFVPLQTYFGRPSIAPERLIRASLILNPFSFDPSVC